MLNLNPHTCILYLTWFNWIILKFVWGDWGEQQDQVGENGDPDDVDEDDMSRSKIPNASEKPNLYNKFTLKNVPNEDIWRHPLFSG